MNLRRSGIGLLSLTLILVFGVACQSADSNSGHSENNKELVVFVTSNASNVREKALSYGLNVKTIDSSAPSSQLVKVLLRSPTDEYFAVINPAFNQYIAGGAVSDQIPPGEIDNLFRNLKQVSKAGVEQTARLKPSSKDKAKLLVFSDFQCPYCKKMEEQTDAWEKRYNDKLEVDFAHYPLPFHENAFQAAEAAECARVQGKFEDYKTELFEHQEELNEYVINISAKNLKLDYDKFMQCKNLHQERRKVRQDQYFGQYMGIKGTPSMFLNGESLMNLSPEQIQAKIDETLGMPSDAKKEDKDTAQEPSDKS